MAALADWINQSFGLSSRPPESVAFTASLPAVDADEISDEEEYLDESDLQGQSFLIEYADSCGEVSTRRVTVRKLHRTDDGCLCLKTFCWERQSARSFRVDRIQKLQRLDGSAPAGTPQEFFERYMHDGIDGEAAAAFKAVRPGLRVLLYLARCDGHVHPLENEIMQRYVTACCAKSLSWETVESFLAAQHPDKALARSMLKAALGDRASASRLLTSAKRLIEADGIVTAEEVAGLDAMFHFSEQRRYQEDIRA